MGILSYLKYWRYRGKSDPQVLATARKMGDYLVREARTPDRGPYPGFTRSTGNHTSFPLISSSQGDLKYGVNVIEPDKGGIAGYALVELYQATHDSRYLDQAAHNAHVLAKNMRKGDARHAPWPFRVDSVTGQHWGERSGDMVYILRLFDDLIALGKKQYQAPRDALWNWIVTYQFAAGEGRDESLWIQFFEDMTVEDNRNSWAPLNMARYLIERKESIDPDWKRHAAACIDFAVRHFGVERPGGVLLMGEQDTDRRAWGGACSTFGSVAAMFYAAGGGEKYYEMAYRNLSWVTYFIRDNGVVCDQTGAWDMLREGGWQEDCHTDVVHNFMDAISAVPQFAWLRTLPLPRPPRHGGVYVVAHRGAHQGIPENSLAAYQHAIDLGADFIEIDIRTTKDGKFVSMHNGTVDAYAKGHIGNVHEMTLAELKSLDIGERLGPKWKGTRIPTFDEILDLCHGKIGIYLDLKNGPVAAIAACIRRHGMQRDVIWYASVEQLKELRQVCPDCIPMPDPHGQPRLDYVIRALHPTVIASFFHDLSPAFLQTAHGAGAIVIADESDPSGWQQVVDWGLDGIQTNHPAKLIEWLDNRSMNHEGGVSRPRRGEAR